MIKYIVIISLLFTSLVACTKDTSERVKASFAVGEKAPAFTLKDLEGKDVRLQDFSGKVVLLEFWATWCPPCKASVPDLIRLQEKYKDRNVVVLAIAVDEGQNVAAKLSDYSRESNINYRVLLGNEEISEAYNVRSIPSIILIDGSGVVRSSHVGFADDFVDRFSAQIDKLL